MRHCSFIDELCDADYNSEIRPFVTIEDVLEHVATLGCAYSKLPDSVAAHAISQRTPEDLEAWLSNDA